MVEALKILDAAEAYEEERTFWTVRVNKAFDPARFEIVRCAGGDPEVKAWTNGEAGSVYEMEERRMLAAMTVASKILEATND